jgi:hypothetical protein
MMENKMANELEKAPPPIVDGFDADDEMTGERRVIQGTKLAFSLDSDWVTGAGIEVSPELELIVVDRARVVQRWANNLPAETIWLGHGEKLPDIEQMNAAVPKSEWRAREGSDKLEGPWQPQNVIYLLDPQTLDRFSYPTWTTGGNICVDDIASKTRSMRKLRGEHVYPVVTLGDTFMPTRFGGRQRPHFIIKRFITFGEANKALPGPGEPSGRDAGPPLEQPAAKAEKPAEAAPPVENTAKPTVKETVTKRGVTRIGTPLTTVKESSSEEIFDDKIDF